MVLLFTPNSSIRGGTLLKAKVPHQAETCPDMSKNLKSLLKYYLLGDSPGDSNVGLSEQAVLKEYHTFLFLSF